METVRSFISQSVTQMDLNDGDAANLQSKNSWIDDCDINIKLNFLFESSKVNFENLDSAIDNEDLSSSPSSLHSYESLLDDDESLATPSFSIDNSIPPSDIIDIDTQEPFLQQQHDNKPHSLYSPNLPNTINQSQPRCLNSFNLTPIDTPENYEWSDQSDYNLPQHDMEQYRRVMQQTKDFVVTDQSYSLFQQQFISNEIYPQVITTEANSCLIMELNSAQSTITQASSANSISTETSLTSIPASSVPSSVLSSFPPSAGTYSSTSELPTPMPAKRKNVMRKKRKAKSSQVVYDENFKPIAQQLMDNEKIWNLIITKKKKGIYKCTHCTEIFKDLIDLAKHMDSKKIARQHKCPFDNCPWSIIGLPRRAEVRRHCAAQHAYVITFDDDKSKSSHEPSRSPEGELSHVAEKYHCEFNNCSKAFRRKDALQRHEKLVHLNPESRFNRRMEKEHINKLKKEKNLKRLHDVQLLKE